MSEEQKGIEDFKDMLVEPESDSEIGEDITSEEIDIFASTAEDEQPKVEAKNRLMLIAEGGAHIVEYFHKNNVFPSSIVLDAKKFREMLPYLTKTDDVLVLVKGLTDFTMSELYAVIHDIEDLGDNLNSIAVLSNVSLGVVNLPYYEYTGDLFYGSVKQVINGKPVSLDEDGKPIDKKNQKSKVVETKKTFKHNPIMKRYLKFDDPSVKITIYGSEVLKDKKQSNGEKSDLEKIIKVDRFKQKH